MQNLPIEKRFTLTNISYRMKFGKVEHPEKIDKNVSSLNMFSATTVLREGRSSSKRTGGVNFSLEKKKVSRE